MNGSLTGNRTVFPNGLYFACDPGFILSGSTHRTCQANGSWDGLKTVCNGESMLLTFTGYEKLMGEN